MNRCLLIICILVLLSCFKFGVFDNNKSTGNCSQGVNLSSNIFTKDIHRNDNKDNTSKYIVSVVNNETKRMLTEVSYVSDNSSTIVEKYGKTHLEENSEQEYKLKAKFDTDNISYPSDKPEGTPTVPNEEPHPSESSIENDFLFDNFFEKNAENVDLLHLNETISTGKVSHIVNKSDTLPLTKKEVCITQSIFESTIAPTQRNATSMLISTQLYCNVSSELSPNCHKKVQDMCYTYIHGIYIIVKETFEKLVQVQYFANELKEELESIRNPLLTTQSEDVIAHANDCTLGESYQSNFIDLEQSKLRVDHNFHEVEAIMFDLDKLFNIFEDIYRNGKHNSKVLQHVGMEIMKVIKSVNTLMNLLQKESNSFLRAIPEFKVKCK